MLSSAGDAPPGTVPSTIWGSSPGTSETLSQSWLQSSSWAVEIMVLSAGGMLCQRICYQVKKIQEDVNKLLTSLDQMSKRSLGSSLRPSKYKSMNSQPYQRRSRESQCQLGWETGRESCDDKSWQLVIFGIGRKISAPSANLQQYQCQVFEFH